MKTLLILVLVYGSILIASAARAVADEKAQADTATREIPLKDIWAYRMPCARDIQKLEPKIYGENLQGFAMDERAKRMKESLIFQIVNYLGSGNPQKPQPARPGFAVLGRDSEALHDAHSVLVDDQKAKQSFPSGSNLSLVFFSKVFDYGVGLDQVERQGNKITIKYFFAPIPVGPGSAQFALIPLGELPVGEMAVDMVRTPTPPKYNDPAYPAVDPKWDALIVCRPFKFTIDKRP